MPIVLIINALKIRERFIISYLDKMSDFKNMQSQ